MEKLKGVDGQGQDAYSKKLQQALRDIRINLGLVIQAQTLQMLTFTSLKPKTGTTFCAYELAKLFIKTGWTVALIDGNVDTPTLSESISRKQGVSDLLIGFQPKPIKDENNVVIFPIGTLPENLSEGLATTEGKLFVQKLRETYDLIFWDVASFEKSADARYVAGLSDGAILTINRRTSLQKLHTVKAKLNNFDIPLIGVITNG
ncbi:MAG: hypothetical protein ACK5NA_09620 [Enterococcus sp.]